MGLIHLDWISSYRTGRAVPFLTVSPVHQKLLHDAAWLGLHPNNGADPGDRGDCACSGGDHALGEIDFFTVAACGGDLSAPACGCDQSAGETRKKLKGDNAYIKLFDALFRTCHF